ncbi:MAG: hypothetical protein K9W43_12085 [Candidatus Thorarchaeota archaeon]|nr:hypothetical protein [Candidatus Thorarchaeota archaeon]
MKAKMFSLMILSFLLASLVPLGNNVVVFQNGAMSETPSQDGASSVIASGLPSRNVRVALFYDDDIATGVSYSATGTYSSDFTGLKNLFVGAGYTVTTLTRSMILNHELQPTNYDVLVLPDMLPDDDIVNHTLEFWLGGGGILSIDGSINFIVYAGIFPQDTAGDNGFGNYWNFKCGSVVTVANIQPPTKSKALNEELNIADTDYATFNWSVISSLANAKYMTPILKDKNDPNNIAGLTYDSPYQGGRTVQIVGSVHVVPDSLKQIYLDSVEWLAPRPRGRIGFDLSHRPRLGVDAWDDLSKFPGEYKTARNLWVHHGYIFEKIYPRTSGNLTLERLSKYDMVIIVVPDYNYTDAEIDALITWVNGGGSLFVAADGPLASFVKPVAQLNRFLTTFSIPVDANASLTFESAYRIPHLVNDEINQLNKLYGARILPTGDNAFSLWEYNSTVTVIGGTTYGKGRLIVSGDMNWFAEISFTFLGYKSERKLVLNIANWLINYGSPILLYYGDIDVDQHLSPAGYALLELGLRFCIIHDSIWLAPTIEDVEPELLVVDAPMGFSFWENAFDAIKYHIDHGHKLVLSTFGIDIYKDHPIWPDIGVSFSEDSEDFPVIHFWDTANPIFNQPFKFGLSYTTGKSNYVDNSDTVHVLSNATAIAGRTSHTTDGEAFITVRNDGLVVCNSVLISELNDTDQSGYSDSFELYINEIAYVMKTIVDHPPDICYTVGSTGNSITWTIVGYTTLTYQIKLNGTVVAADIWNGRPISYSVDGLGVGTYIFVLTVSDQYGTVTSDEVVVTVTNTSSGSTTTTTTTGTTGTTTTTTEGTVTTGGSDLPGPPGLSDISQFIQDNMLFVIILLGVVVIVAVAITRR